MINLKTLPLLALAMFLGTAIADEAPTNWDGLIEVKPRKMDAVFLMPGADFRPYTKVMVDPTEVAFRKDWMKEMNEPGSSLSRRVTEEDAAKILEAARSNFDDIFQEAFTKAGYAVVTAPDRTCCGSRQRSSICSSTHRTRCPRAARARSRRMPARRRW